MELRRKFKVLCPDEGFFALHSWATEQEKDKIWVQKMDLQRISGTQDEFVNRLSFVKEIFEKFIKRECSDEELRQLIDYVRESSDMEETPTIDEVHGILDRFPDMDEAQVSHILKNVYKAEKREKAMRYRRTAQRYVGAVIIIALISTTFLLQKKSGDSSKKETIVPLVGTKIEIGTDKAILTLDDGAQIALEKGKSYQANSANSNGEELIYDQTNTKNETAINLLTIPRGGQFYVKLSDGTQVWLNSESQLKYPVAFKDGAPREVELVYGEAYFDVSPSTDHSGSSFKVHSPNQDVEVLGTEFNIKAYRDEDNVYTTLVEGKVVVNNSVNKQDLQPNQQSIVSPVDIIAVNTVDVYGETSWRNGLFSFKGKALKEIMRVLSRWYDFEVIFEDSDVENIKFNGVLSKDDSIDEILSEIKNTNFINAYEIKERTITIN